MIGALNYIVKQFGAIICPCCRLALTSPSYNDVAYWENVSLNDNRLKYWCPFKFKGNCPINLEIWQNGTSIDYSKICMNIQLKNNNYELNYYFNKHQYISFILMEKHINGVAVDNTIVILKSDEAPPISFDPNIIKQQISTWLAFQ